MNEELYPFPHTPRWSDTIPPPVQKKMVMAVELQLEKLPLHLQFEWHKPCYIERSFFLEASKHIAIPGSEYWQDERTS